MLLVGALFFVAVYALVRFLLPSSVEEPKGVEGSVSVREAFLQPDGSQLVVRGFVFDGGGLPLRLCDHRQKGEPPECRGGHLLLDNFDRARLTLIADPDDPSGVEWVEEEVSVYGTRRSGALVVQEILR